MSELSAEFVKFCLGSVEFRDKYPNLVLFFFVIYSLLAVASFCSFIVKLKDVFKKDSRLSKLIELQKKIGDNDKRLVDFTNLQIKDELFKECTGYFNCTINKLIVDFYISNGDRFTWREIKLIISRFEIREGQLKLKPRNLLNKLVILFGYIYYGLMGLLSLAIMLALPLLKIQFTVLVIPVFAILGISVWMILVEGDQMRIYKKMLKEPSFKTGVINKSEEEE